MAKYNKKFELNLRDIDAIESALRAQIFHSNDPKEIKYLNKLLGKLHDQKIWYRPPDQPYISG